MMHRRDFIGLFGSAAFWPLAAHAEQPPVFNLGYLEAGASSDRTVQDLRRQLILGLRDLGYIEGRHFQMHDRFAAGQTDRLRSLAAELVKLPVDVIAANGEAPIRAARKATSTIPIVMLIAADPVGSGFIASLARPGGNITGMSALTADMSSKRVELLKEMIPNAQRVAVVWNPANASKIVEWKDTQEAAEAIGLTLRSVETRNLAALETGLASLEREPPDGMLVLTESVTIAFRDRIGRFALAQRIPMISALREFADVGALATYGTSRHDLWRRSASYIDKIVRGAKPADLPVEQPTRFELVINLKAAKAINLKVAPTMLTRADEVIE